MRYSLIFPIYLFLFSHSSFSQANYKLLDTANIWSQVESLTNSYHTNYLKLGLDTTIGNRLYFKVYQFEDSTLTTGYAIGAIYSDVRKVYYRNFFSMNYPTDKDILIYDFDLSVNDTFRLELANSNIIEHILQEIDTVVFQGISRRVYRFDVPEACWIEGVGSINGSLLYPFLYDYAADYGLTLLCLKKGQNIQYVNPVYSMCYLDTFTSTNSILKKTFQFSPNPITDILKIEFMDLSSKTFVSIFSISGKLIFSKEVKSNILHIPTSKFNRSGLHLLEIRQGNNSIIEKILIM